MRVVDVGDGPAVVLVHGQPGWGRDWERVTPLLTPSHRVIVPDRPGYGRSGASARGIADNAEWLVGLLDQRGVDSATIAGHSWGGGVALALAQRYPERVTALVLASSVGTRSSINGLDHVLGVPVAGEALAFLGFRVFGRLLLAPQVRSAVGREATAIPVSELVDHVRYWRRVAVWRTFALEQRALLRETPALEAGLGQVQVPTTVLVGERDTITPVRASVELAERIPGARLQRIPGVGHLLPYEAPDQVAAAISASSR